jgi:competence protein ComEA
VLKEKEFPMFIRYVRLNQALTTRFANAWSVFKSLSLMLVLSSSALMLSVTPAQAQTAAQPAAAQASAVTVQNQVNINTADAETLALALDGVGMAKAQDIIAHREQHGSFKTVDDLQNVRGIGKATLERNRERILVDVAED